MMKNNPTTIITSHVNTDFDALASVLAAQKLYPDAVVVFPGSYEKNLRNFFVQTIMYLFNMADIKDIDFSKVKRLVLVDTRQVSRIGKFSELISKPDIEIHIYDHHPYLPDDIRGHYEVIHLTGATTSIMTEILKEKQIDISPDEATIMGLGIYEDTGSFTFSSTTERDMLAAAYLLSKGANLRTISDVIAREITSEQVGLLNDMLQSSHHYNINGVDVVVTTVTSDGYVPEFAVLVDKTMKMENLNCIFAIAYMGNKIYIIARSRTSEVDVASILRHFGGGGHPFAASVTLKDMTLIEAEVRLMEILNQNIRSSKRAKDLMSAPPIKTDSFVTCEDAKNLLTRYNINALIVTDKVNGKEVLAGYITRQVIEKAIFLKLHHALVRDYMTTELGVVGPDAELPEIQKQIIENKQRVLPVVDNDKIVGVITRTDLLNTLVQQNQLLQNTVPDPFREDVNAKTRNIVKFMKERLSERIINVLKKIGEVGDQLGYGVYVVGGFVRDLFLYRLNEDIDIVIEGDGISFARTFASLIGARVHVHQKFGTAVIIYPDGFKIDVASARMEYYRFPADLPNVEMSSIKLDMFRRDFTINTLSIQLNPDRFGTLIDFFSAQKDIKERVIRVLHNLSFVEDPTRVFRAIRFEQRFGFTIGKLTASLMQNVIKKDFFKNLSGKRIFTEIKLILEEENPLPAIKRLHDYDLLSVIDPSIKPDTKIVSYFSSVKEAMSWHDLLFLDEPYLKWVVYFMVLTRHCKKETIEKICNKFELANRYQVIFCKERFDADMTLFHLRTANPLTNSRLYRILSGYRTELILYMMAVTKHESVKKAISHYYTRVRQIKLSIRGKDLKEMGIHPGPLYTEILEAALDAKLNGWIQTKDDEIKYAQEYFIKKMQVKK